ncbi:MAG TPA: lipoprotein-releasing system ATP-binding protein LolD, partial [Vibrio sp.]|nr:lipoprotein-releasing system ATP-binding protein LolD [Vibrio sp.]
MVFQSYALWPHMSVWANVAFGLEEQKLPRKEIRNRVEAALELVGLLHLVNRMPSQLSGGQQQRVAIARALIHNPSLVIADEPTASLDSHTANLVIDIMKELGHEMGTTFIVATHDPRMAQRCDRVIELIDGQLAPQAVTTEAISWAS